MHLGFHQASAVVAAPLLPEGVSQPVAGFERLVAHARPHQGCLPRLAVLARGNNGLRPALSDRRMACLGVVCHVCTDIGHRFVGRYLRQQLGQLGQRGRVAHAVVGHFDGSNLQRLSITPLMYPAPLPPILSVVLFAFSFTFTQELDSGAVHQQVQRGGAGPVGQLHRQRFLATAYGTEIGHAPVQAR